MDRVFLAIGSASAFLSVGLGAFGAHGLRDRLTPDRLDIFEVGVRYQMYHALALLAVSVAVARLTSAAASAAGWLFVFGTVVFSGSLYALSVTGVRWLGAITPIGGMAFLIGWLCLLWAAVQR